MIHGLPRRRLRRHRMIVARKRKTARRNAAVVCWKRLRKRYVLDLLGKWFVMCFFATIRSSYYHFFHMPTFLKRFQRALGSKSSKSSTSSGSSGKGKGGSKLSAKSSKSSKSEDKESRSHAGGKENRGNTGNDQGGNTGDDGHRELGSSSCKKQCKKKFRKCKRGH